VRHNEYRGDNNVESRECASGASRGAQPDAVTGRDVRPSNFRDRVFERYESIPQVRPTDPNRVGSFTSQNGAGAESAMGKGEESSAETRANHIGGREKENRGGTKGTLGEDTGGEEEVGCVEPTVKRLLLPLYFVPIISRRSVNAAKDSTSPKSLSRPVREKNGHLQPHRFRQVWAQSL
jgi:hypothetical protein